MPTVDFYSKGQTDTLLSAKANSTDLPSSAQLVPSTSGATSGDVLTFNGSSTEWAAAGGGSGIQAHTYSTFGALYDDIILHPRGIIQTFDDDKLKIINIYVDNNTVKLLYFNAVVGNSNWNYTRADIAIDHNSGSTVSATGNRVTGGNVSSQSVTIYINRFVYYY